VRLLLISIEIRLPAQPIFRARKWTSGPMHEHPIRMCPYRPSDPAESFLIRWKRDKTNQKEKIYRRVGLFQLNEWANRVFLFRLDCLYSSSLFLHRLLAVYILYFFTKQNDAFGHVHLSTSAATNQYVWLYIPV
jgi:hypothetical protein